MSELGVGDEEKQFDGVWQQQQRRRCEHHLVRHRQNRADRARLARWRVIVVRWLLLRLLCDARSLRVIGAAYSEGTQSELTIFEAARESLQR